MVSLLVSFPFDIKSRVLIIGRFYVTSWRPCWWIGTIRFYIFSKIMRPLARYWRLQAFRIAVYLDHGLGVSSTITDCYSMAVKSDLIKPGFVANTEKSIRVPAQSLRWLGYHWDSFSIPEDKINKLQYQGPKGV